MNLLDRYIFKSVLGTCLGAVALFTFVLTLGNVIRDLLAHVLAGQLPAMTLVRLVWLWVPAMAIYALPMGLLTGVLLTLGRLSADSEVTAMRAAGKVEEMRLSLDKYFGHEGVRVKQEWLTYSQLQAERLRLATLTPSPEKAKDADRDRMKLELVFQDKINLSLSVLSFALIGVPLGIRVSRRETSANLGLALGLVLAYYVLTVMVKWLDRHPEYHPDLLLWLPNLFFLGLGAWLFSRLERAKS